MNQKTGVTELPADEQEDISAMCEERGMSMSDFEFHVIETFPETGVDAIHRVVTVFFGKGKENHIAYDAGNGDNWVGAFEKDLLGGAFS